MITARDIDDLCEFVLVRLAGPDVDSFVLARDLVAHIAATHPQAPALSPVLPLAMAATALEQMLGGSAVREAADGAWRMAALLAAEVLALQAAGGDGAAPPRIPALWDRLRDRVGPDGGPDGSDPAGAPAGQGSAA